MDGKKKVAVIGECMIELQKNGLVYTQTFGGDTLNTAIYLSRLTKKSGVQVSYITGLGYDVFSEQMLIGWKGEGIYTGLVQQITGKLPGLYIINTSESGERSFLYWRENAAAKFWLDHIDIDSFTEELKTYHYIYLSGISLAILSSAHREILFGLLQTCRKSGVKIAFDNNYRPALWQSVKVAQECYDKMLSLTDMAFITLDDERALYSESSDEACLANLKKYHIGELIVKRGKDDCFIIQGNEQESVPAQRIQNVVDTTAAGDSFSGGYLAKRLLGASTKESALAAHKLAGTVIQHRGAIISESVMPEL